jgi:hypothetical protein
MTELDDVIRLLRENRPEATELELDQIKQRVRRRAARPSRRSEPMKSRLAILATLVLGMLLSTTGAGLAIQGLSGGDDASVAQYVRGEDSPGDVAGDEDSGGDTGDVAGQEESGTDGGDVAGGDAGGVAGETAQNLQPARQAEVSGESGELPFTGFLAIPILVGGVALLSTGMLLRRRSSDRD